MVNDCFNCKYGYDLETNPNGLNEHIDGPHCRPCFDMEGLGMWEPADELYANPHSDGFPLVPDSLVPHDLPANAVLNQDERVDYSLQIGGGVVIPLDAEGDLVSDVVQPEHYTHYKIEPITFTMRNDMEFWRGNVIKYASRAGYKMYPGCDARQSEIKDLQKAMRYAEMRINFLEGKTEL